MFIKPMNIKKDHKVLPGISLDKYRYLFMSLENRKLAHIAGYSLVSFEKKAFSYHLGIKKGSFFRFKSEDQNSFPFFCKFSSGK